MAANPKYGTEFPTTFPIKAIGKDEPDFPTLVIEIVRRHTVVDESKIEVRPSSASNYISVTIIIEAESKQQLDTIYQELNDNPQVLMTL